MMSSYIVRRVGYMIITLILISFVSFVIIQLPPGDFLTVYVAKLRQQGESVSASELAALSSRYGLGEPMYVQYWKWISGIVLHGDFGQSFALEKPVADAIWGRLPLTVVLGLATLFFVWAISLPAGVYAAVRKHSFGDYTISIVSFFGLSIPGFLLALVLSYIGVKYFGSSVGGLFSPEYEGSAWNLGKILDLLSHLWIPIVVIGMESTAGIIRIMRANLLDELGKPYVVTARSKGLAERRLIMRYPLRIALNPFISTAGWVLPALVNGEVIVAQVLGLHTTGPLLVEALKAQDMYLAGGIVLIIATLTVIGTLASDILLAKVDPRVRIGRVRPAVAVGAQS